MCLPVRRVLNSELNKDALDPRSEERRVGKECSESGVDLGGRRIIQAEDGIRDVVLGDWSSDVCSSDLLTCLADENNLNFLDSLQ